MKADIIASVEVRRAVVETVTGVSKATGQRQTWSVVTLYCEGRTTGQPMIFRQFLPEGANAENTKLPFKKGDVLTLQVVELQTRKGIVTGRFGEIEMSPKPNA